MLLQTVGPRGKAEASASIEVTPRYSAHPVLPERNLGTLIITAKPIQILKQSEPATIAAYHPFEKRRPSTHGAKE